MKYAMRQTVTRHWFLPAAAFVLLGDLVAVTTTDWTSPRAIELGVLADLLLVLPVLYSCCYRHRKPKPLIKALAVACLGIWAAGHLIPTEQQVVTSQLEPLRYIGLAALVMLEIKIGVYIWREVFSSEKSSGEVATQVSASGEMPAWVARLMAWEAGLWRRLARAIGKLWNR